MVLCDESKNCFKTAENMQMKGKGQISLCLDFDSDTQICY